MLQEVALRLRNAVRKSDTVARLGGDEFVVLLPAVTKGAAAENVATQIISALSKTIELGEYSINIGSSIGVAVYPENGMTELELMQAADSAMYQAKRNGKNTVFCAQSVGASVDQIMKYP